MESSTSTAPATVRSLAKEVNHLLKIGHRDNGDAYIFLSPGAPEWMGNLVHAAHSDMLPDDYRYEFIVEALNAIIEYDDTDEARDSLEADIYTSDLTGWLHSRNDRINFVDESRSEWGADAGGIIEDMQRGQLFEKYEVFGSVLQSLSERLDALNA